MKHWKWLVVVLCLLAAVAGGIHGARQAMASDYENTQQPMFVGVERVYLYVNYLSVMPEEEVPEPLRQQNIEQLLKDLYEERFSSTRCEARMKGKKPYSCNDQPVLLLTQEQWVGYRSKDLTEARKQPGSLTIVVSVRLTSSTSPSFDPPLKEPVAAIYVVKHRPEPEFPLMWQLEAPFSFPIHQKEGKVEEFLFKAITNSIH